MWGASIRAKLATVVPSVTKEAAGTSSSTATKSNINQKNSNISYIDVANKKKRYESSVKNISIGKHVNILQD